MPTMLAVHLVNDHRIATIVKKLRDTMYTAACFILTFVWENK